MIEMLRIYSKGFLENITIEELPPWPFSLMTYYPKGSGSSIPKYLGPLTVTKFDSGAKVKS
jgi:hypothetical protein